MAGTQPCKTCGKSLSVEAKACPHCGQPDPINEPDYEMDFPDPFLDSSSTSEMKPCINCGMKLKVPSNACVHCGEKDPFFSKEKDWTPILKYFFLFFIIGVSFWYVSPWLSLVDLNPDPVGEGKHTWGNKQESTTIPLDTQIALSCCNMCGGTFSFKNGCSPNSACYGNCLFNN